MNNIKQYFILCRLPISLFAACSAATGYLVAPAFDPVRLALLAAGVFLLAAGASALNQYQERDIDMLMERTRFRPLPAGTLSPRTVMTASLLLLASGLSLLGTTGAVSATLGVFTVLWYNGLYTPLKRRTAFAAVPGALVGAIPPLLGWAAGNGRLDDPKAFALAALFFLWQVPHFWLLLLAHRDAYERAGLPHLFRLLPGNQLARITFLWTAAASLACIGLPLFGLAASPAIFGLLLTLAFGMTIQGLRVFRHDGSPATALAVFRISTVFLALLMILLSIEAVIRRS